jgi:hypothetical protein
VSVPGGLGGLGRVLMAVGGLTFVLSLLLTAILWLLRR